MLRSCPVVGDPMGPSCKQRFRDIEASMIASAVVLDSYNYGIGYVKGNAKQYQYLFIPVLYLFQTHLKGSKHGPC